MRKHLLLLAMMLSLAVSARAADLTGTVSTDGSTSMEKVIGSLGEAFTSQNKQVKFTYNPTGSGAGIAAVQAGRCDIGLSSRNLKDEEKKAGLKSTPVALDGIAVVVNPQNKVDNLTMEQIAGIFSGKIQNWKELGGVDAAIVPIGREAGSGTRDGFESVTKTKDACRYRQELTSTGDVITTVSRNPGAIGYASLGAVKKSVKPVAVNGVAPSESSVRDASYKLQRPFLLITVEGKELSPAAKAFLAYSLSPQAAGIIAKAGAVAPK